MMDGTTTDAGVHVSFQSSIQTCLSKFATFSGRAGRPEYWWFQLFYALVLIAGGVVDGLNNLSVFLPLVYVVLFLPTLAVTVRRLHDIDRSGWWVLLAFVPVVGTIALLVGLCQRGSAGPNAFGDRDDLVTEPPFLDFERIDRHR